MKEMRIRERKRRREEKERADEFFLWQNIFYFSRADPLEGLTLHDIKTAIRNAAGSKATLFIPEKAFELLMKKQIELFRDPCFKCAEKVFDELAFIVTQMEADVSDGRVWMN